MKRSRFCHFLCSVIMDIIMSLYQICKALVVYQFYCMAFYHSQMWRDEINVFLDDWELNFNHSKHDIKFAAVKIILLCRFLPFFHLGGNASQVVGPLSPLVCLVCVICNSNSFHSFIFKLCIMIVHTLNMFIFYFVHISWIFSQFWGCCVICNSNSFRSLIVNTFIMIFFTHTYFVHISEYFLIFGMLNLIFCPCICSCNAAFH